MLTVGKNKQTRHQSFSLQKQCFIYSDRTALYIFSIHSMVHCSVLFQIENCRRKRTTKTDLSVYFDVTKEREIHSFFLVFVLSAYLCLSISIFEINTLFNYKKKRYCVQCIHVCHRLVKIGQFHSNMWWYEKWKKSAMLLRINTHSSHLHANRSVNV